MHLPLDVYMSHSKHTNKISKKHITTKWIISERLLLYLFQNMIQIYQKRKEKDLKRTNRLYLIYIKRTLHYTNKKYTLSLITTEQVPWAICLQRKSWLTFQRWHFAGYILWQ